jgi:hypothetical protein
VDLNLDTLKSEILHYLEASAFAVFHSSPGTLEGQPLILWDAERHPDYRMFLDVARQAGCKLVCFASREFQPEEIDDLLLQLEDSEMDRDEQREYQKQLRRLREHEGVTCTLELAFDYGSRLYVYEMQPDWFTEFLNIEDEILAHFGMGEDEDVDDNDGSLGNYFSKN